MTGILAYGSLINDPGEEIEAITVERRKNIETPFKIEFARSSRTRKGAPTLVPVNEGGAKVQAVVFVYKDSISEEEATNILWRRETGKVGQRDCHYTRQSTPTPNSVLIKKLENFVGLDVVLYTDFPDSGKIAHPDPGDLAKRAIKSAEDLYLSATDHHGRDGISYLMHAKSSGISTPLMPQYETEILHRMQTPTLKAALSKIRASTLPHPYIVNNNQILNGEPVIWGTRTPVRAIVETWRQGVAPEVIPSQLPHLTLAQVFDALSYYSDHQDEINSYIERNRIPDELIDPLVKAQ